MFVSGLGFQGWAIAPFPRESALNLGGLFRVWKKNHDGYWAGGDEIIVKKIFAPEFEFDPSDAYLLQKVIVFHTSTEVEAT